METPYFDGQTMPKCICSLNRTMQYGNVCDATDQEYYNVFKSYYVVWKQGARQKNSGGLGKFKSYYVVWKHTCVREVRKYFFCLNRTMQYGNNKKIRISFFLVMFKSYYVVWKLFGFFATNRARAVFKSYYVVWKLFSSDERLPQPRLFKSYYVVWKP